MGRKLLFIFALLIFIANPSFAAVTIEETTDAEYLINSGYSQAIAEDIFVQKNRIAGNPTEALYEKSNNYLVKCWRKLFAYIDPAQDNYDRIHHDIKLAPHPSDL